MISAERAPSAHREQSGTRAETQGKIGADPKISRVGRESGYQANQACLLSGNRLLPNREWQGAAAGTPDPGAADDGSTTCVTTGAEPANTGSRSSCKSVWGAFDMIGNVDEWVPIGPTARSAARIGVRAR